MKNKLFPITMFIAGVITALALLNLYRLASRNLVLENWLLEQEINDYLASKVTNEASSVIVSEAQQSVEASDD